MVKFDKIGGVLAPKSLAEAENWLNYKEKASFLLIFTKSVEPIFQTAGPILRHTALEGTLLISVFSVHLYQCSVEFNFGKTWISKKQIFIVKKKRHFIIATSNQ